jgi:hypothetical protein
MSQYKVKTPHAAVLIWNYKDRIGTPTGKFDASGLKNREIEGGATQKNQETVPVIVSTLSCVSIQTNKSKGRPDGSFNLVLAPFKNWTSNLTAGSWCCLLMSNEPILEKDLKHADKNKVKMLGRIESVRTETKMDADGTRKTLYYVTGTDWGDIFNSTIYIDNLIKGPNDKGNSQGDVAALALRQILFANNGSPRNFDVNYNLTALLSIMGKNLGNFTGTPSEVGRLANAMYEFALPNEVINYFDFRGINGNSEVQKKTITGKSLNNFIKLISGSLINHDKYYDTKESLGFIDPFSIQGTHSLWQILLENSNPALNEMLCDFRWSKDDGDNGVVLAFYNRIKPFAFKDFKPRAGDSVRLKSYFQYVKTNKIQNDEVISVNAGTNWRDKINFIEIKPQFSEFKIVSNWIKQKSQVFDPKSFEREGFRAMIVDTKQFPAKKPLNVAAAKAKAGLSPTSTTTPVKPTSVADAAIAATKAAKAAADRIIQAYKIDNVKGFVDAVHANHDVNSKALEAIKADLIVPTSPTTAPITTADAAKAAAENDAYATAFVNNLTRTGFEPVGTGFVLRDGPAAEPAAPTPAEAAAAATEAARAAAAKVILAANSGTVEELANAISESDSASAAAASAISSPTVIVPTSPASAPVGVPAKVVAAAAAAEADKAAAAAIAAAAATESTALSATDTAIDWNELENWAKLMREWFFGTHRMLNGTMVIHGTTSYIGIGENIIFDAGLINPTPNINQAAVKSQTNAYILAHIESVQHSFAVDDNGARTYRTTIQFVRGITVNSNNEVVGEGMLDQDVTKTSQSDDRNRLNTVSTSDIRSDPDPQKVRGT